jgi:hypothetical protein
MLGTEGSDDGQAPDRVGLIAEVEEGIKIVTPTFPGVGGGRS